MAAHPRPTAPSTDSKLVTVLVSTVVVLVAVLTVGGYWMQKQRNQAEERVQTHRYENAYESYLRYTRPDAEPKPETEAMRKLAEAQATRKYLMEHPAVTPGPGFDKPGVQSTGKAIVDAMDQAKGL